MRTFTHGTCRVSRTCTHRERRPGRTFMELIVVLVILGLAAGLIVPRFAAANSQAALKAGARKLITAMGYARTQAVAEGRSYRLEIDPNSGELRTTYFDPEGDPEEPYVPDVGILGERLMLPTGVSFSRVAIGEEAGGIETSRTRTSSSSTGTTYIQFSPDGTTEQAVIVVANEEGAELTVALDQFTGRARVLEPEEAEELRSELELK
jgi:Tfp pilus assembly protein FimT